MCFRHKLIVYTDLHSTFLEQGLKISQVYVGRAGDYVAKVDAKICSAKDTYRKVEKGLPWTLPHQLAGDYVVYVVSHLNIRHTITLNENVCA